MTQHQIRSLRGMHDVLPTDVGAWQFLESCVRQAMNSYGYLEMRTPVAESTALFNRSIGEVTDIVEKEMYTFDSRGGESISLRPEATASCVRAAIQHGLLQTSPCRIWYLGPMFRYERPQKGRTRQFHQAGAEVYGLAGPEIEAELILLSARLWRLLGIADAVQLEVNTLGNSEDRARFRTALVDYFSASAEQLDDDSRRRLQSNPLRILDSKNPAMKELIAAAPALRDYLCDESKAHFDQLRELLAQAGVSVIENPNLVRGLDYYSHTVFEWTTDKLGAQSAVCAGGRYDGLVEQLGGKPTPGVGWAMGLERLVELLNHSADDGADVYIVRAAGTESDGFRLAEALRSELPALSVMQHIGGGSLKSQFKKADRSGARYALVVGASELEQGSLTIKPLREQHEQMTLALADGLAWLKNAFGDK